jgi:hypothetical protein
VELDFGETTKMVFDWDLYSFRGRWMVELPFQIGQRIHLTCPLPIFVTQIQRQLEATPDGFGGTTRRWNPNTFIIPIQCPNFTILITAVSDGLVGFIAIVEFVYAIVVGLGSWIPISSIQLLTSCILSCQEENPLFFFSV